MDGHGEREREREREIMDFHRSGLIAFVNAGRAGGSTFCCLIGMERSHKVGAMGLTQHSLPVCLAREDAFSKSQFASDEESTRRRHLVTEDGMGSVSGGGGGLRQRIGR